MPTKINSCDQTITQYNVQSGSTGNLNNNISPGIAGQLLISNGVSSQASFQSASGSTGFSIVNLQIFSVAGSFTYTPTANMSYCVVEVIGAGGGAGNSTGSAFAVGSGGGAGGYAKQIFDAATIGVSQSITIGAGGGPTIAGGSTIFGSLITCTGGAGGTSSATQNTPQGGGIGGSATVGGTFTAVGGRGGISMWVTAGDEYAGYGGDSVLSPGGHSGNSSIFTGGNGQYGSGGGGGFSTHVGGNGGDGLVIITEYIT